MAVYRHGKNAAVFADQFDLQQFLNEVVVSANVDTAETTAFGSGAKTYVVGLDDGTLSANGMFDGTTGAIDQIMQGIATSDTPVSITSAPEGLTAGYRAHLISANDTNYEITTPVSDVVKITTSWQGTGGVDFGHLYVPRTVFSTAATTNSASVDNGAASTNGGVAHLHVTANTRDGAATAVIVQHSTDNTTFTTLASFTSVNAATLSGQRVVVAPGTTVNRYVRAQVTVAGTTGSITATVSFARR